MPTLTSRQVVELTRMLDTGDLADYRPDNREWRQEELRRILCFAGAGVVSLLMWAAIVGILWLVF